MGNVLITPKAILSFPHLFEPQAAEEGEDKKYSACLIFTQEAQKEPYFKALKAAAVAAAKERWGDKAASMLKSGAIRSPFRPGEEKAQYGYPEGSVFMNVRSKRRPGIVSTVKNPATGKLIPITDEEEIYAGAIVRAHVGAFAYDTKGNKGVSFGLNGIMKVDDGERLDNFVSAEDAFDADTFGTETLDEVQAKALAAEAGTEETAADESDPLSDLL